MLYTFAFAGRDTVAAAPQLFAELASLAAVYGIATRLGLSRPASAFAALLTATLSQVAIQSVTTQNDLLTASFLAIALYFVLGKSTPELALAGLALAHDRRHVFSRDGIRVRRVRARGGVWLRPQRRSYGPRSR